MDNGKARVYLKDDIPVIEIYHNGKINIKDIFWMHQCILNLPIKMPCNVILDRIGSYSLTPGAILALHEVVRDHNKVAFVLHHSIQQHVFNYAADSYLGGNDVMQFQTITEACEWLESDRV